MDTPDRLADKTQATYATQPSRINICLQITAGLVHAVALPPRRSAQPASGAEREENFLSGGLRLITFHLVPPPPDTAATQPSVGINMNSRAPLATQLGLPASP